MFISEFLKNRLQRHENALEQRLILAQFWGTTNQLRMALRNVFPDKEFMQEHFVVLICTDAINIVTNHDDSPLLKIEECKDVESLQPEFRERLGHNLH